MSPRASTQFLMLGPLQIWAGDGRRVALRGARQERLVAALLLDPRHRVSIDGLVDAAWIDAAPASGRRQIQDLISRLRRALREAGAADLVHTDGDGYLLALEGHRFDARDFDQAVGAADAAADSRPEVIAALRRGLALWRGPVLDGLHCPALSPAIAHWNERRMAAWERCLAAELELHPEPGAALIEELDELTRVDPHRERPVQLLMTALHRSSRRTEALRTYREFRDRFVADLGLEPGEELRRTHRLVLRDEPARPRSAAVKPAMPRPAQLPADIANFTGRLSTLSTMDAALATPSGPPTVAVTGMAGVGKTSLVVHWAHRIRHRFPDGQLFVDLRGFADGKPVPPAEALRSFLHALGVAPDRVPPDETEASALYRSLLDGCRMLIVLDNAASAEQIRPLLPGDRGCATVITSRRQLTGLIARDGARPVPLDAMTAAEAQDLLTGRLRHGRSGIDPDAITDLAEHCDRLPLALVVVAARAVARASTPLSALVTELRDIRSRQEALVADDAAADIWNVFSWSYRSLSTGAARTFRILGLHPGADIAAPAVASLTATDAAAARAALSELVSAHLLAERGHGRYAFHSLMRTYARHLTLGEDPEPVRRAATVRILDHYLHTAHPAAVVLYPHRHPITLPAAAAGVVPERITERADALAWFAAERRALISTVRAASGRHDRHAWKLAWTLITALSHDGRYAELFAVQQIALAAARRLGDAAMQATSHVSLSQVEIQRKDFASARNHLDRAVTIYRRLGDHGGLANAHFNLCKMLLRSGDTEAALPHAEHSVEEYRLSGHAAGQAISLNALGWCHVQLGRHTEALTYCEHSLAMHRTLDDPYTLAHTLDTLGLIHRRLGRHAEAIRYYRRAGDIFDSLGDRVHRAETLIELGRSHDAAGEPTAAREVWREALALLEDLDHPAVDEVRNLLRVPAHAVGGQ